MPIVSLTNQQRVDIARSIMNANSSPYSDEKKFEYYKLLLGDVTFVSSFNTEGKGKEINFNYKDYRTQQAPDSMKKQSAVKAAEDMLKSNLNALDPNQTAQIDLPDELGKIFNELQQNKDKRVGTHIESGVMTNRDRIAAALAISVPAKTTTDALQNKYKLMVKLLTGIPGVTVQEPGLFSALSFSEDSQLRDAITKTQASLKALNLGNDVFEKTELIDLENTEKGIVDKLLEKKPTTQQHNTLPPLDYQPPVQEIYGRDHAGVVQTDPDLGSSSKADARKAQRDNRSATGFPGQGAALQAPHASHAAKAGNTRTMTNQERYSLARTIVANFKQEDSPFPMPSDKDMLIKLLDGIKVQDEFQDFTYRDFLHPSVKQQRVNIFVDTLYNLFKLDAPGVSEFEDYEDPDNLQKYTTNVIMNPEDETPIEFTPAEMKIIEAEAARLAYDTSSESSSELDRESLGSPDNQVHHYTGPHPQYHIKLPGNTENDDADSLASLDSLDQRNAQRLAALKDNTSDNTSRTLQDRSRNNAKPLTSLLFDARGPAAVRNRQSINEILSGDDTSSEQSYYDTRLRMSEKPLDKNLPYRSNILDDSDDGARSESSFGGFDPVGSRRGQFHKPVSNRQPAPQPLSDLGVLVLRHNIDYFLRALLGKTDPQSDFLVEIYSDQRGSPLIILDSQLRKNESLYKKMESDLNESIDTYCSDKRDDSGIANVYREVKTALQDSNTPRLEALSAELQTKTAPKAAYLAQCLIESPIIDSSSVITYDDFPQAIQATLNNGKQLVKPRTPKQPDQTGGRSEPSTAFAHLKHDYTPSGLESKQPVEMIKMSNAKIGLKEILQGFNQLSPRERTFNGIQIMAVIEKDGPKGPEIGFYHDDAAKTGGSVPKQGNSLGKDEATAMGAKVMKCVSQVVADATSQKVMMAESQRGFVNEERNKFRP